MSLVPLVWQELAGHHDLYAVTREGRFTLDAHVEVDGTRDAVAELLVAGLQQCGLRGFRPGLGEIKPSPVWRFGLTRLAVTEVEGRFAYFLRVIATVRH